MIYLVYKVLYTSFGSTLNRHQPYHPNRKNDGFWSYLANTIGPPARLPHGQVWKPSLLTFWAIEISGWETGKTKQVRPFRNNPYVPLKILETSLKFHWKPPSLFPKKELYTANSPFCWDENGKHLAFTIPPKYIQILGIFVQVVHPQRKQHSLRSLASCPG